jgi:hypothetical protein
LKRFKRDFSLNPTISELPGPGWLTDVTEATPRDMAVSCHHYRELMADDSLESLLSMMLGLGDRVVRNHNEVAHDAAIGCTHLRITVADGFRKT